jgi:hypothetical protein
MTEPTHGEVAALLQAMLQQQTAMLELQRVLLERVLGAPTTAPPEPPPPSSTLDQSPAPQPDIVQTGDPIDPAPAVSRANAPATESSVADVSGARSARYYQPRSSPAANLVKPAELELMWRLQEMRESGDLILQFGPFKGTTLARVAVSNPEYVRQLMKNARRPEVRAAAGRLVQALDAV